MMRLRGISLTASIIYPSRGIPRGGVPRYFRRAITDISGWCEAGILHEPVIPGYFERGLPDTPDVPGYFRGEYQHYPDGTRLYYAVRDQNIGHVRGGTLP